MKGKAEKGMSLYLEWLLLLFISGIVSLLFFMGFGFVVEEQIGRYHENREVIRKYNEKYIEKLQNYVREQDVSSTDDAKLDQWIYDNGIIYIQIKKDGKWIYSSDMGMEEEKEEFEEYEFSGYAVHGDYEVEFKDGPAQVNIMGIYYYNAYMVAVIANIVLTFLLFILLTMLGIRKKIRYINRLSRDIEILEGGNLEYQVEEQGRDEITDLARGINSMKNSFRSQITEVESLTRKNQEMVTEISHDLRTPLTSVLLYAEILLGKKWSGEQQRQEYLEKIVKKIEHMKGLSDKLLEYAVSTAEERYVSTEYVPVFQGLYDELSDMCCYLDEQGIKVEEELSWKDGAVCLCKEYLTRILDNISSNILKYADREKPVLIRDDYLEGELCISFENFCVDKENCMDSYSIGIRNVKTLAREMGGSCEVTQRENIFRICLRLRYKQSR